MRKFSESVLGSVSTVARWRLSSFSASRKVESGVSQSISTPQSKRPLATSKTSLTRRVFRSGILVAATAAVAAIGYSKMSSSPSGGWWVPSSEAHLAEAEEKVLSVLKSDLEMSFVELDNGHRVRTMVVNRGQHPDKVPLVLVHGFGASLGTWAKNVDELGAERTVYALDQVGFGRSDRPEFSKDAQEAEEEFVENLEQWRAKMGLESFMLLGHSLGGFVSTAYAFKYPQYIRHLVLAEPWGFTLRPAEGTRWEREMPIRYKMITFLNDRVNPLGILRAAGPLGLAMFQRARKDIQIVFSDMYPDSTMMEYMYHSNVQQPSGEVAMKSLMKGIGFAERPMLERIGDLSPDLNVSFLYGKRSWNDSQSGVLCEELLGADRVSVDIIEEANHHIYGFDGFNGLVSGYLRTAEAKM